MKKHIVSLMLLSLLGLTACPGGGVPGVPGSGGGTSDVDPNTCGNYAASDAGKKLKAFLAATVTLNEAVIEAEAEMKVSCDAMATELGVSTDGDTATVCKAVSDSIKEHLSVGLKAGAKLELVYDPPVCTINAEAAASAAASCEGSASADIGVACNGVCEGKCDGTCEGSSGDGGECNGTCEGSCQGSCQGYADVDASVECDASAEITASVEAECTKPSFEVKWEAEAVIDAPKVEKVKAALMAGMPKMLQITAMVKSPLLGAFKTWATSAKDLADSSAKLYKSLGDQASCVAKQLGGAVKMIAAIKASLDVQVEVSVSVSASASAEGSAGS
jgi:hypothetical protein